MEFSKADEKKAFDPKDFGFVKYRPVRGAGASQRNGSYYLYTSSADTKAKRAQLELSFKKADAQNIIENIGGNVDIWCGDGGSLILTKGTTLKMAEASTSGRRSIACSSMRDDILGEFGEFRRLYLDVSVLKEGSAILVKPNGDRE